MNSFIPILSVIMPIQNCANYVSDAIKSILGQTMVNFELIIIDDCSTDSTNKVVTSFNDNRIKFIRNNLPLGICDCLNYGISLAQGKYIVRMDGDDISEPDRFHYQFEFMEANPEVGLLGTWYTIMDCNTKVQLPLEHNQIIFDMLEYCPIAHPTVFIRRAIIDSLSRLYDANYVYAEDYELWSRISQITKVANLPYYLLKYRKHDMQSSKRYSFQQQQTSQLIRKELLKKILPEHSIDLNSLELSKYAQHNINSNTIIIDILKQLNLIYRNNCSLKLYDTKLLNEWLSTKKWTLISIYSAKQNRYKRLIYKLYFMLIDKIYLRFYP